MHSTSARSIVYKGQMILINVCEQQGVALQYTLRLEDSSTSLNIGVQLASCLLGCSNWHIGIDKVMATQYFIDFKVDKTNKYQYKTCFITESDIFAYF